MLARVSPPRWRLRVAAVVAILSSAALAAGGGFPAPDRPVAAIISPVFSDEATRDRHGEADRVLDRLGVTPGTRVADIGAGTGFYTVRGARRLGSRGTVDADVNNCDDPRQ